MKRCMDKSKSLTVNNQYFHFADTSFHLSKAIKEELALSSQRGIEC